MSNIPESFAIEVTCPGCGQKSQQALVRLHQDRQFECSRCGPVAFSGDALEQLDAAFKEVNDQFAKLSRTIVIKF